MGTWRCGTCHSLMVGKRPAICKLMEHEAPYDDEAGEED